MQRKLIIFDMDGTVVNTGVMITKTINYVREHMGLEPIEQKLMLEKLNDPDLNSSEYFYGTKYFTDKQTELFEDYYNENCIIGVELYDGMKELLDKYSQKYTLTIATNAHTDFAKKILSHLEVDNYFDLIIGADMVTNPKPHPEMLEKTMKKLKFEKNNTVLIGDSLKDQRASISANIECKLVNWGFSDHKEDEAIEKIEDLSLYLSSLLVRKDLPIS